MRFQSINPATGEVNKDFETLDLRSAISKVKLAKEAQRLWGELDVSERSKFIARLSDVLKEKSKEYGRIITLEMGKPIKQAVEEVEKCALAAKVYAENAARWLEDEDVAIGRGAYVTHEPLGTILGIMPWNFPFWQALRFAIPAMSAGNTAVLRHSNVVPMSALAIEDAFKLAGFPENTFMAIITDHGAVGALIKSRYVDGVSLTGSVDAGRHVARLAAKNLKKFVLELGGSDPFIVLDDADIHFACRGAADGRLINSGQSCICSKRFIVVEDVAEGFAAEFADIMKNAKVGDPMNESTEVGPLANSQQLDILERQVGELVSNGAKVLCGGKRIPGKGYFFEPTVLMGADKKFVAKNELFGPVASIIKAKDENDAIKIANDTRFGLGASVWTKNEEHAKDIARKLQCGVVYINGIVKSNPLLPFGGIKDSGVGRELSRYGLLEFTNIKSVVLS